MGHAAASSSRRNAIPALIRDNRRVVPTGFVHQAQLSTAVDRAVLKLGDQVVRVRHSIGSDTSGEPAIFFRIILPDSAVQEATLADVTGRIATTLFEELRPYENWGLTPYFRFRGDSEQMLRNDPEWA
jgi:hypothetical protein